MHLDCLDELCTDFWSSSLCRSSSYTPSQADVTVYKALEGSAPSSQYPHAARWYRHITSYSVDFDTLSGDKSGKSADDLIPALASTSKAPAAAAAPAADDDDDVDLFGSDDEEEDAEAEKLKQQRLAEYAAKKANKPKTIAKVRFACVAGPSRGLTCF